MADADPRFEAPEGVRFACTRCGDCCRTWNILLGPGEEERIEGLDWKGREERLIEGVVTVPAMAGAMRGRRLAREASGACVFLSAENDCLIHRHFGEEAKPLMCRLYPFAFSRVGGRVAVDCSFACTSIAEGSGTELKPREAEWVRLLAESGANEEAPAHVLDEKRRIDAEVLWELEHAAVAILKRREFAIADRVRAMARFFALAADGDPSAPHAAELRKALSESLLPRVASRTPQGSLNTTQRAFFLQELYAHLNPPPEPGAADAAAKQNAWVEAGTRFRREEGPPRVDGRAGKSNWDSMRGHPIDAIERDDDHALETYFAASIVGQRFRFAGTIEIPLREAAARLALRYPMIAWTARALASERGENAQARHVRAALRLVDRAAGRIPLDRLDARQKEAVRVVLLETDIVDAAISELRGGKL